MSLGRPRSVDGGRFTSPNSSKIARQRYMLDAETTSTEQISSKSQPLSHIRRAVYFISWLIFRLPIVKGWEIRQCYSRKSSFLFGKPWRKNVIVIIYWKRCNPLRYVGLTYHIWCAPEGCNFITAVLQVIAFMSLGPQKLKHKNHWGIGLYHRCGFLVTSNQFQMYSMTSNPALNWVS